MRKLMRETIKLIRDYGGSDVLVTQGTRHTRIHFTSRDGRRLTLLIPQGHATNWRFVAGIRSQIRRRIESSAAGTGAADACSSIRKPAAAFKPPAPRAEDHLTRNRSRPP